ncbi:MAG: glycosyltransferase [Bacteroidales bacterium]|nr:glycosyltransferase [Bacteroidales bacterium]
MKILQLGKFYPVRGGVEKVMYDLTDGISEKGIACDMLCAALSKKKINIIQLNECGRVICVKALCKKAGTMIAPFMISYLRKHRREYDIIHVHHPDPMAAVALLFSGFKGRVILHWHSDIVSQKEFFLLYKPLQNWLVRRADKIVCTTPVYFRESPHLAKVQDKCTYVPIGIRPIVGDEARAAELRAKYPCKCLILSVGRLVPYKGYEYLIDAMKHLPEDFHLVIGGTGPMQDDLLYRIAEKGLDKRITMLGLVPDDDLHAWYLACDVFVLPSVMKTEAFGIVQIEAMSCGKPVVATRIPGSGVPWVNLDGQSGVNVEPRDPAALAEGIRRDLQNAPAFGQGARKLFQERYTLDSMINKTIQIYEQA